MKQFLMLLNLSFFLDTAYILQIWQDNIGQGV